MRLTLFIVIETHIFMKLILFFWLLLMAKCCFAQEISTIDFVQVLEDNEKEAIYYYKHNWEVLREMAQDKGYIQSYQFLKTEYTEEAPFHLMLVTTYANEKQYEIRELHFAEVIKEKGSLELMNNKKPDEFRRTLFSKEARNIKNKE